ncbi:hypothetical protein TWF225_000496 [Orbilia oligospora]|nr:hypothetical protein TWF225_000496 [Orbilia oligospora]KAF3264559.1 hypothetical protein TWF128_001026 [Orbilia oligospora]KAF3268349.1 hypothetical protein TWF217_010944 [Orbilia oligospora]KAF3290365.1 hypothetical protein TWF132_006933 [Orbilia oligospora]
MSSLLVKGTAENEMGGPPRRKLVLKFMLNNPEYSDMTVFAGVHQTPFKLHRAVICIRSGFFKACCDSSGFKEGTTKAVYLAEIEPEVFKKVVLWLYEERYGYILTDGHEYLKLIQAADLLKIESLRVDILNKFYSKCRHSFLDSLPEIAEELLGSFVKICQFCQETDLTILICIMKELLSYVKVTPKMVLTGLTDGSFGKTFMAALVGAQSETECSECGVKMIEDGGERKRSCARIAYRARPDRTG